MFANLDQPDVSDYTCLDDLVSIKLSSESNSTSMLMTFLSPVSGS